MLTVTVSLSLLLLSLSLPLNIIRFVDAFPAFYIRIPNGDKVPHVCPPEAADRSKPAVRWPAVGHWRAKGGDGSRQSLNPFGRDFAANKFQWTVALCRNDSDLDGRTNGEELGDPNCQWTMASHVPPDGNATSHPGICEPIDSPRCAEFNWPLVEECPGRIEQKLLDEDPADEATACPPINNPAVKRLDLRLTNGVAEISMAEEPHRDVVHFCQMFTLPSDQPYHIIAITPAAPQPESFFVSHVTMHACVDQSDIFNLAAIGGLSTPSKTACQLTKPCSKLVGTWKFNSQAKVPIVCLPSLAGIRFGQDRFDKMVVDFYYSFRWTNPNTSIPVMDVAQSGVTIFYTPKLRRYDVGVLLMGENYIKIPPGQPAYNVSIDLPNHCVAKLITGQHTITPFQVTLHANKLIRSISMSLQLGQYNEKDLAVSDCGDDCLDRPFSATKVATSLMRPVDGLAMRCTYDSEDLQAFTFFGPPPDGETCYGALTYYPADNSSWFVDATQIGQLNACQTSTIINSCPYEAFASKYQDAIKTLRQACDSRTYPPLGCPADCKTLIVREDLLGHDCLAGDIFQKIVRSPELMTSTVPFSPFEASTVAGTIDLCRLEIYAIVIEKAGLKNLINKTRIQTELDLTQIEQCTSSGALPLRQHYRRLLVLTSTNLVILLSIFLFFTVI